VKNEKNEKLGILDLLKPMRRAATSVSVPGGSHKRWSSRSRRSSHMKGGITDNGEESQGREEEGRQETVS
jgi:hypothetical protein